MMIELRGGKEDAVIMNISSLETNSVNSRILTTVAVCQHIHIVNKERCNSNSNYNNVENADGYIFINLFSYFCVNKLHIMFLW